MSPAKSFNVIIIGVGSSGIFCAYKLIQKKSSMRILMMERGRPIEKRVRPRHTTRVCVECKPCFIVTDFVGAGAFSDGKLPLSPDIGGDLSEILGYDKTIEFLKESDGIYLRFGAGTNVYGLDKQKRIEEVRRKITNTNLKLIEYPIRHLGTEEGYRVYTRLQEHLLAQGVTIEFDTMIKDIIIGEDKVKGALTDKDEICYAPKIVSAIGHEGSDQSSHICGNHGIEIQIDTVDIGIRMGVKDEIMKFLNDNLYEIKLVYYTLTFDGRVRTFYINSSDEIATEYYKDGLAVVDGHAYKSKEHKIDNVDFVLLASKNFTKPFDEPTEYGRHIAQLSNMLCGGRVVIQTFDDFQRRCRTTEEHLCRNNLTPTLKDTVPGDLSLVSPHRIMTDIREVPLTLDKVTPGIASDETLLYGVEVKFYPSKVIVNIDFETSIKGLQTIGNGVSVTHGLQQASANSVSVVGNILKQMET